MTENGVGGMMSLLLAGMIVIIAQQGEEAENALDFQRSTTLADFPRLGLVGAVDPLGSLLEELSDELGGGFKNGGAQQFFQIGHDTAAGLGGAEGGNQLLDFFFLGKGIALGVRRFFLTPAFRSCRETSEIPATCSSTSFIKCS